VFLVFFIKRLKLLLKKVLLLNHPLAQPSTYIIEGQTPTPTLIISPTNEAVSLEVPPPPQTIKWTQSTTTNNGLSCYEYEFKEICKDDSTQLNGTLWTSEQKTDNRDDFDKLLSEYNQYSRKIEELNWKWEGVKVNGAEFSYGHGDGPFASSGGLVGVKGVKLRGIQTTMSYDVSEGNDPSEFMCPCNVKLSLFITDIIPLSDLLK